MLRVAWIASMVLAASMLIIGSSRIDDLVRDAPRTPVPTTNQTEFWNLKGAHYLTPAEHRRCAAWALGMVVSVFLAIGLGVATKIQKP
jgi:hypothetical protein